MSNISVVNTQSVATPAANSLAAAAGTAASTTGAQIQDQFMKMLVAQMQYQDPTNPMDSSQMTSQLAQINTVDGINQLNATMTAMSATLQTSQAYQAAGLIGKTVMAPGSSFNLTNSAASFGVQVPTGGASSVAVNILNASGQVVDSMNLGSQGAGVIPLSWNGQDASGNTLPDGAYTLQVIANSGGVPVAVTGLTSATVKAVSTASTGGAQLILSNNSTTTLSSVTQIQ
jgi:flagellar basal-body rod modification protein FlgD